MVNKYIVLIEIWSCRLNNFILRCMASFILNFFQPFATYLFSVNIQISCFSLISMGHIMDILLWISGDFNKILLRLRMRIWTEFCWDIYPEFLCISVGIFYWELQHFSGENCNWMMFRFIFIENSDGILLKFWFIINIFISNV